MVSTDKKERSFPLLFFLNLFQRNKDHCTFPASLSKFSLLFSLLFSLFMALFLLLFSVSTYFFITFSFSFSFSFSSPFSLLFLSPTNFHFLGRNGAIPMRVSTSLTWSPTVRTIMSLLKTIPLF